MIFKRAGKLMVKVMVVANRYMRPPPGVMCQVICAGSDFDAADDYIAEHVEKGDLVITSDVPLADRVIGAGAFALSAYGREFDPDTIKEALTMRNLNHELRSAGEIHGGPEAFGDKQVKAFAGAFDRWLGKRQNSSE